jgi:hypothetical protein
MRRELRGSRRIVLRAKFLDDFYRDAEMRIVRAA